ncbi:hypothetical protein [Pseudomonas sp. Z1-6]|uniref:hypothetical protein n=1 Tax=Pseudomonas sp. Z1-6 TaxID=2817407 RepID=UPI003DA8875F
MEASEFMERLIAKAGEFGEWNIVRIVEERRGSEVEPGFCWSEASISKDDPDLRSGWLYFAMGGGKYLFVSYIDVPSSRR